ncbi:MAG: OadG family protein [Clostridiales bacterium]|jgi:Na+-transporting methylmalonyl-CoA/oxaloacetate decarboxylase gamma subunit|nr:OadG family protein [Clostridiales bacterium]
MTLPESLMVALFCVLGVFLVLLALCFLIKLFSYLLGLFTKKTQPSAVSNSSSLTESSAQALSSSSAEEKSTGTIILKNVDEQTAAVIMAIVSHESGIPLSKLDFKSIKLVD